MTRSPSLPGFLSLTLTLTAVLLAPSPAHAAECGCDHEIAPGTTSVNGTTLGFQPGDVVCVMAGDYEFIRFREVHGTPEAPIVIKNCGGVVQVRNTDRAYAVDFQGSSHHFRITGTGEPGVEYGFRVSAPDKEPYPGVGLWFLDKSTSYEADHIEVYETGFAGVMSKTDPLCDGSADQAVFVQKDVHLHHLWVHDTGGEGLYIGSTQSNGHKITCNGMEETHQPHFLEGIEVDHLLVEDTGWDGMQIGMAHEGCNVHDNVLRRVGLEGVQYQVQGLQIGTYSKCEVRRNVLSDGPAMGVFVLGAYDTTVADNLIVRFEANSVYANLSETPGPAAYRIAHNTMVGFGDAAVKVFGDAVEGAFAWNNLVVGPSGAIAAGNDVGWTTEGNQFAATIADAGFVAPDRDDFHLAETSFARGAGADHTADGFAVDLDGLLRAMPPSAGAYEVAADSPSGGAGGSGGTGGAGAGANGSGGAGAGMGGSGANAGTGASAGDGGAAGGGSDDAADGGGCGCRAADGHGPGAPGTVAATLLLFGLCARRRRRISGQRSDSISGRRPA